MLYTTIKIGEKELKCRLNAKALVDLERKMGQNPLGAFINAENGEIPKVENLINILHASLQAYEHGYTIDEVYKLYDEYVDTGNTLMDLVPVVLDIFKCSGFFKETAEVQEKN